MTKQTILFILLCIIVSMTFIQGNANNYFNNNETTETLELYKSETIGYTDNIVTNNSLFHYGLYASYYYCLLYNETSGVSEFVRASIVTMQIYFVVISNITIDIQLNTSKTGTGIVGSLSSQLYENKFISHDKLFKDYDNYTYTTISPWGATPLYKEESEQFTFQIVLFDHFNSSIVFDTGEIIASNVIVQPYNQQTQTTPYSLVVLPFGIIVLIIIKKRKTND